MRFFLTGTDTSIGKTYFARLVLERASAENVPCHVWKPVCCGGREDLHILAQAQPAKQEDDLCHAYFHAPAAPSVAAALEGKSLSSQSLIAWCKIKADTHTDALNLFEGAGGWMVPLRGSWCIADLAQALGFPVVIIVGERLGCLNPTLLTARDIQHRGLTLAGIILNQIPDATPAAGDHWAVLQNDFHLPVWGRLPAGTSSLPDLIWQALKKAASQMPVRACPASSTTNPPP